MSDDGTLMTDKWRDEEWGLSIRMVDIFNRIKAQERFKELGWNEYWTKEYLKMQGRCIELEAALREIANSYGRIDRVELLRDIARRALECKP